DVCVAARRHPWLTESPASPAALPAPCTRAAPRMTPPFPANAPPPPAAVEGPCAATAVAGPSHPTTGRDCRTQPGRGSGRPAPGLSAQTSRWPIEQPGAVPAPAESWSIRWPEPVLVPTIPGTGHPPTVIGLVRRQSPSETADPLSVARTGRVRRSFPGPALPGLPPGRPRALPFRLPAPHGLRTDRCSSRIGHRPTTPGSTRTPNRHVQPYVHHPPAPPAIFGAPAPYPVHRR